MHVVEVTTILSTLCACAVHIESATSYFEQCQNEAKKPPFRYFSSRTPYAEAKGKWLKERNDLPGCHAEQVYAVFRHGTRYPADNEIEAMEDILPFVRDGILKNANKSSLCPKDLQKIQGWTWKLNINRQMSITDRGLMEHYTLGARLQQRFPHLFNWTSPSTAIPMELRYTNLSRSRQSMRYFLRGLLQQLPNQHLSIPEGVNVTTVHITEDRLMLYCDLCDKYTRTRMADDDMERLEVKRFELGPIVGQLLTHINNRLGLQPGTLNYTAITVLYEACRYGYAIDQDDTWCRVFTTNHLKILEYGQDLRYFWKYGWGRPINYTPSCYLLQDIVAAIHESIGQTAERRSGLFRFGHSRTLLPLLTRLGLYIDQHPLMADNVGLHLARQWRLSLINPFASNFVQVLYSCGPQNHVLRTFVNEHPVKLPQCDSFDCPLEDALKMWTDITTDCDMDELCA